MKQLGLFAEAVVRSPGEDDATRALAARLPRALRFGTSSWSFPGWRGIVWPNEDGWSETKTAREGLRVYARHPLLRTVSIDRSFYGPLTEEEARRYASQTPDDFRFAAKVWDELTSPRSARFLSPSAFLDEVLAPYAAGMSSRAGPMILELKAGEAIDVERFASQLAGFLRATTPKLGPFSLTLEIRDRRLLVPALGRTLAAHDVPLCFSFHPTMPSLAEQASWASRHGLFDGGGAPVVIRLMLPPGEVYAARKSACAPFDRIVGVQNTMRAHVVDLVARAVRAGREVFVLVNNKAEGSAPLTIRALAELFADA